MTWIKHGRNKVRAQIGMTVYYKYFEKSEKIYKEGIGTILALYTHREGRPYKFVGLISIDNSGYSNTVNVYSHEIRVYDPLYEAYAEAKKRKRNEN